TYRFSPDVVRHGLDQSSSLSVHQSPLSQQCKHRKAPGCGNFLPGGQGGVWARSLYPEPRFAPRLSGKLLVSDENGRLVAAYVRTGGKVRLQITRIDRGSAQIWLLICGGYALIHPFHV